MSLLGLDPRELRTDPAAAVVDHAAKIWPVVGAAVGPTGSKFDGGKVPFELLPEDALEAVARVLRFGAQKYAARNWENGISFGRLYGAMRRHGVAWFQRGEELDPETGEHHLAHLACEVLFALAHALRKTPGLDDRPGTARVGQE